MKPYIKMIESVLHTGGTTVDCENFVSKFIVNVPASDEEIAICNTYSKNRLPEDYISFLKYYNGATLFEYDGIAGFKFLGTNEIVQDNEFRKEGIEDIWDNNILLFCYFVGMGEYLGFRLEDTNKYTIVHCFMDMPPSEWTQINDSFDVLMETLIKEKGKEYWLF